MHRETRDTRREAIPPPTPAGSSRDALLVDRMLRLEELVSHQQHLLDQLNQVAIGLQAQLDRQQREHQASLQRLREELEKATDGEVPIEKPPHY